MSKRKGSTWWLNVVESCVQVLNKVKQHTFTARASGGAWSKIDLCAHTIPQLFVLICSEEITPYKSIMVLFATTCSHIFPHNKLRLLFELSDTNTNVGILIRSTVIGMMNTDGYHTLKVMTVALC